MITSHRAEAPPVLGAAAIVRIAYEGGDLSSLVRDLQGRLAADPNDFAAMMDLAVALLVNGHGDAALQLQRQAIEAVRCYKVMHGDGEGLRILAFKAPGDLMANTPIEFLLEGSNTVLFSYFITENTRELPGIPEHDIAMVAIGESDANAPMLENLSHLLADWPRPVLNGAIENISALTRTGVAGSLSGQSHIVAAPTVVMDRSTLEIVAARQIGAALILPGRGFPVLVRPIGSHAGQGLERLNEETELDRYLASHDDDRFYVASYIDYSGADGFFRKYRIAVIDGRPYASHLAVSKHWMVHYLNADMETNADRRAQEEEWMVRFETDFARRHKLAFEALTQRIGLDYFAIDCAETRDGRLLIFEADVAMIVHALDPAGTFPYKKPAMRRLFNAFLSALQRRHERARGSATKTCAQSGKPAVYQRTRNDCMVCAVAMLTGQTYEQVTVSARALDPIYPVQGPMSHSIMRGVAHRAGQMVLSSIYMNWEKPAIIGVRSPTIPDAGHAVFWDGEKIIDPGTSLLVDRDYVDRHGIEFTQRARDVRVLVDLDGKPAEQQSEDKALETV